MCVIFVTFMFLSLFFSFKVVGFGLRSVFELIRETRNSHPSFCARALKALLDTLQGLAPEELASEPSDIMGKCLQNRLNVTSSSNNLEEFCTLGQKVNR